ncbi:MAG: aminoacyl-tRNA hydrolase [Firmicutes bacterium]|jgi:PTH1 family peptidyl-tRNA hydrolase|nr:aminoacyl-tRNA hydrolase [Bacillota bacterium]MBQ2218277.1 aminoacyl-tRNA hydrolase [Bacillota bacterium]
MYIICGLGNPGKEYEQTRHNMGFLTMDVLAYKLGIDIRRLKFRSLIGEGRIGTEKVILVKPQTYMNNSGEALREIVAYYDIDPQHLIVVYDDIDLPVGDLRLREKGSAGTHNGMRSIIYQLQFDDFPRIRIGTGKSDVIPLVSFVTGKPTEEEQKPLADAIEKAAQAVICWVEHGPREAMQRFNHKPNKKKKQENGKTDQPDGAVGDPAGPAGC